MLHLTGSSSASLATTTFSWSATGAVLGADLGSSHPPEGDNGLRSGKGEFDGRFSASSRQLSSSLGSGDTAQMDGYLNELIEVFRLSLSPTSQSDSDTSPPDTGGELSFCDGIGDSVLTLDNRGGGKGGAFDLCVNVLAIEQLSIPVSFAFCDRKLFRLRFPIVSIDVCDPRSPEAARSPFCSPGNLAKPCLRPLSVCIDV